MVAPAPEYELGRKMVKAIQETKEMKDGTAYAYGETRYLRLCSSENTSWLHIIRAIVLTHDFSEEYQLYSYEHILLSLVLAISPPRNYVSNRPVSKKSAISARNNLPDQDSAQRREEVTEGSKLLTDGRLIHQFQGCVVMKALLLHKTNSKPSPIIITWVDLPIIAFLRRNSTIRIQMDICIVQVPNCVWYYFRNSWRHLLRRKKRSK